MITTSSISKKPKSTNKPKFFQRPLVKIATILILAAAWMATIYNFSAQTSTDSNGNSTSAIEFVTRNILKVTNYTEITHSYPSDEKIEHAAQLLNAPLRKVMHASVYCVLAIAVALVTTIITKHRRFWFTIIITVSFCMAFAALDELHQTSVAGRTGQPLDVLIDSLGALTGLAIFATYHVVYILGRKSAQDANRR